MYNIFNAKHELMPDEYWAFIVDTDTGPALFRDQLFGYLVGHGGFKAWEEMFRVETKGVFDYGDLLLLKSVGVDWATQGYANDGLGLCYPRTWWESNPHIIVANHLEYLQNDLEQGIYGTQDRIRKVKKLGIAAIKPETAYLSVAILFRELSSEMRHSLCCRTKSFVELFQTFTIRNKIKLLSIRVDQFRITQSTVYSEEFDSE